MNSLSDTLATVKAYRRTGCAVITVERNGRARRHTVSLRRYRAFYFWTIKHCPWKCNGAWMRHGMDIRVTQERWNVAGNPGPGTARTGSSIGGAA